MWWEPSGPSDCFGVSIFLGETRPLFVVDLSSDEDRPRPVVLSTEWGHKVWSLSEELMRVIGCLGFIFKTLPLDWEWEWIPCGNGVRSSSSSTIDGKAVGRTGGLKKGLWGEESKSLAVMEPRKRTRSLAICSRQQ